jgi:uncharacterized protein YjbI with pentapeptide repeats
MPSVTAIARPQNYADETYVNETDAMLGIAAPETAPKPSPLGPDATSPLGPDATPPERLLAHGFEMLEEVDRIISTLPEEKRTSEHGNGVEGAAHECRLIMNELNTAFKEISRVENLALVSGGNGKIIKRSGDTILVESQKAMNSLSELASKLADAIQPPSLLIRTLSIIGTLLGVALAVGAIIAAPALSLVLVGVIFGAGVLAGATVQGFALAKVFEHARQERLTIEMKEMGAAAHKILSNLTFRCANQVERFINETLKLNITEGEKISKLNDFELRAAMSIYGQGNTLHDTAVRAFINQVGGSNLSLKSKGTVLNFKGLDLDGADFSGLDLTGASFKNAELFSADFSVSSLNNVDFNEARLNDAVFTRASGNSTDFTNATMNGVVMDNAQFSGAF